MTASPTADISELYMHVTDHTARLSSVADYDHDTTTRSLEDMRNLINWAKEHDKAAKESKIGMNGNGKFQKKSQIGAFKDFSSLAQLTPLHKLKLNKDNLDAAEVFELVKPFLESYLGTRPTFEPRSSKLSSLAEDPFTTPKRSSIMNSELDSENNTKEHRVDDTFDKRLRKLASPANLALLPATTPPLSREFKDFETNEAISQKEGAANSEDETEDAGVDDSDMCKYLGNVPQVELADLTEDEIRLDTKKSKGPDMNKMVTELRLQLERAKQESKEMANEISYLKDKLAKKEKHAQFEASEGQKPRPTTASSVGSFPVNNETVEPCFRPYYSKLQLDKVDGLLEMEKSNVIKNLMLSLLVSDFDHLQQMAPRVGDYLRISSRFLDKLHMTFYGCAEYCPSKYLRDYDAELMDDFQACLDGMMEIIKRDVTADRPPSRRI